MKTKLEELLERPFDAYMRGCWQHAFDKAGTDPIAMYLYEMAVKEPAAIEAQWAKRYWFHKNGAYEDDQLARQAPAFMPGKDSASAGADSMSA